LSIISVGPTGLTGTEVLERLDSMPVTPQLGRVYLDDGTNTLTEIQVSDIMTGVDG